MTLKEFFGNQLTKTYNSDYYRKLGAIGQLQKILQHRKNQGYMTTPDMCGANLCEDYVDYKSLEPYIGGYYPHILRSFEEEWVKEQLMPDAAGLKRS